MGKSRRGEVASGRESVGETREERREGELCVRDTQAEEKGFPIWVSVSSAFFFLFFWVSLLFLGMA